MNKLLVSILLLITTLTISAEDGHQLWLRMQPNNKSAKVNIDIKDKDSKSGQTLKIAQNELRKYFKENTIVHLSVDPSAPKHDGFSISRDEKGITIKSSTCIGCLYGTYNLLRQQQTQSLIKEGQTITDTPTSDFRLLNHWDNLNGTIERGFAGKSIFWSTEEDLSIKNADLIEEYARANASVGINGAVLNNVNASPKMLLTENLEKVKRIADILRPYGVKVYLSVNFASPKALGDVATADPLNEDVIKWWQNKVKEVYNLVPDFGGFLVKANSEGEPGPQDFGRTHVDGANMLADILKPYNGIVMWRAFVYAANSNDRACQAYNEFMPFDGKFHDNVILQIKNGPVDFQPREPISPLFYSLKHTKVMPELQITQEYLGESIHTVFLATMWKELTDQIKNVTGFAGVSNVGNSKNWCGSDMAQANWYAFGRMAWNSSISSEEIAKEFIQQTFSDNEIVVKPLTKLLLESHETCVSYMMPLGLHHIFAGGHHYGPEPWYYQPGCREDWLPRYYHKADSIGLGFDRTVNGSGAVLQYPDSLSYKYDDLCECPEKYLLWFHHVGWNQELMCGETLWNRLCHKYDEGIKGAESFVKTWNSLRPYIDKERFENQLAKFNRQAKDAWWWRDACLLYFQQFSKLPLPADCPPVRHNLSDLMKYHLAIDNYTAAPMDKLP